MNSSPQLATPPINEVVCGFVFNPTRLTTLDFGVYWERRRDDFPRHELHPPILEGAGIRLGPVVDARVWLVARDEEVLLQLQHNRFYMNWRRRGENYPRFSDHGSTSGLKRRAIAEFKQFEAFARERTHQDVEIVRLELTKIDVLEAGKTYRDMDDLRALLPVTRVFEDVALAEPRQLQLQVAEADGPTSTHIAVMMDTRHVRIETRHAFPLVGDLNRAFDQANERVNRVFFGLVNTSRFQRRPTDDAV